MAGVQVPTLKRVGPAQLPATDKIEAKVSDGSQEIAQTGHAAARLADAGDLLFNKFEDDAIRVQSTAAGNQFEATYKGGLRDLRNREGDPALEYQAFDKRMVEKKQEILKGYDDASPKMRRLVTEHLDLIHGRNEDTRQVEESIRRTQWDKTNTNDANNLIKERALDSVQLMNVKDPTSIGFTNFQKGINELKDSITKFHDTYGGVFRDEKGNVKEFSKPLLWDLKKETSDTVMKAVKTLNDSGKVEEAAQLMKMYKDELTNDDYQGLLKHGNESLITQQANGELSKLPNFKDPGDIVKAIDMKKGSLPYPVINKMLEIADTANRHRENLNGRGSKMAFELGTKAIRDRAAQGNPYVSMSEFMSEVGNKFSTAPDGSVRITTKQIAAWEDMIVAPKHSNTNALGEMYQAVEQGQLEKWDFATFSEHLGGLRQQDQDRFTRLYTDLHSQTPSERNQKNRQITTDIKDRLVGVGLVKKGAFNSLTKKEQLKLNDYRDELNDYYDTIKGPISDQFIRDTNKEFISKKLKGEAFTIQTPDKLQSAPKSVPTSKEVLTKTVGTAPKQLTDADITKWAIKFKQDPDNKNHEMAKSMKQLREFIAKETAAGNGI